MLCFFFNDTATTEIYTLSLHDALPISRRRANRGSYGRRRSRREPTRAPPRTVTPGVTLAAVPRASTQPEALRRSEEPRLNSSHANISYAVFCLKKKNNTSLR